MTKCEGGGASRASSATGGSARDRSYDVSSEVRPYGGGMLGSDTLVVLGEAHLLSSGDNCFDTHRESLHGL
jgi:hypothetical protein